MNKFFGLLLALVAVTASAQTPVTSLPNTNIIGTELITVVQLQAGGGCTGITVIAGYCGAYITPLQLKAYIGSGGGGGGSVTSVNINSSGILGFSGGPITSSGVFTPAWTGTSGGVPYFASASSLQSSPVLGLNNIMIGGGAGQPPGTVVCSSATTVLHGGNPPSCIQVNLGTDVTGLTSPANGGSGVNNGSNNETRSGNINFGGQFSTTQSGAVTEAFSGATTVTFPAGTYTTGYLGCPVNSQGGTYGFILTDSGKCVLNTDTSSNTFTIPANSSVAFPVSSCVVIMNGPSGGTLTIAITSDTLYWLPTLATGSRTMAAGGVATICKIYGTTQWAMVSSAGVT
jgi:hypothetical protein